MKLYVLLLCAFFIFSCKNIKEKDHATSINIDIESKNPISDILEKYQNVTLKTSDTLLISSIDKLQTGTDNQLYILDKKEHTISIFKRNGDYLNKLDRYGAGPEEYLSISDFQINKENIYILSRISKKINIYTENGDFIDSYPLNDYYDYFYIIDDKNLLLYSNYSNDKNFNIIFYNYKENTYRRSFLPFERNQNFSFTIFPFNKQNDESLFITQQYDYNIYKWEDGFVKSAYTFSFNTKDKLPEDYQQIDFEKIYKNLTNKSVVKRIEFIYQKNNLLYLIYELDYAKRITSINTQNGEIKTAILESTDKFPFAFANPILFEVNFLISYLPASAVLMFDPNFPSDKNEDGILKMEDNPVLFFHALK